MENVSKALLIAAAILVVIILVAFGVKVLNSTSGSKDAAITIGESISATAFNSRIKMYAGANKSPTEVCKLLEIIKTNNEKGKRKIAIDRIFPNNINNITKKDIKTTSEAIDNEIKAVKSEIVSKLNIYLYYHDDGYIGVVGIENRKFKL